MKLPRWKQTRLRPSEGGKFMSYSPPQEVVDEVRRGKTAEQEGVARLRKVLTDAKEEARLRKVLADAKAERDGIARLIKILTDAKAEAEGAITIKEGKTYRVSIRDSGVHWPSNVDLFQDSVLELRRISGLTWTQLATLLGVSERTVRLWASGVPVPSESKATLRNVCEIVKLADKGRPSETGLALTISTDSVRRSIFDHMVMAEYGQAKSILGTANPTGPETEPRRKVNLKEQEIHRPIPPEILIGALQDNLHDESPKAVDATPDPDSLAWRVARFYKNIDPKQSQLEGRLVRKKEQLLCKKNRNVRP